MENIERNGITLGDLLKAVAKKIWIVLIATFAAAIAGALLVTFMVNPARSAYSLEFTLVYPGREQMKYPDGSPFYYQDIVSEEMLERVRATDEKFGGVKIEELLKRDKITITEQNGKFTLTAAQSCFENYDVATLFLKSVAAMPLEIVKERAAAMDFHLSESVYKAAYSFEDRIALLSSQRNRMIAQYDNWIAIFDNSFLVSGKALKNYRADMEVVFSNSRRGELLKELEEFGYVLPERLVSRIAELNQERTVNETKIRELKAVLADGGASSGKDMESFSAALAALIVRNVEIDYELESLTEENIAAFEQIIDREYERLEQAADSIQAVAAALYEQEARVSFVSSRVGVENNVSAVVMGIGAGVVAFLIASGIICYLAYSKAPKSEKSEKDTAE